MSTWSMARRRLAQRLRASRWTIAFVAYCGVFAALRLAWEGLGWRSGWYLLPYVLLQALALLLAIVVGLAVYAWLRPRPLDPN
jgi:hypothetical protein